MSGQSAAASHDPSRRHGEVCNAIFSQLHTGCQWRSLPKEYPNSHTVFWYLTRWTLDGAFGRINDRLRRKVRVRLHRDPEPSAGSIDSQSVKTTENGGPRL